MKTRKEMASFATMLCAAAIGGSNYFRDEPDVHISKFSDKSKALFGEPKRELKEFSIKGQKIMAYSRKDAIKRLKHQKKV